ncbi:MAG: hypothetical protein M3680_28795, partial [Myxococcota bacterium]|nr:hypothetical protein [Myxococcota bacterium]
PAPRPLDERVAEPPVVRVEVLAPPPPTVGAIWVAGHWRLVGARWHWIAGRWILPPAPGERYRVPAVRVRNNVRVYVPGGWIRLR